MATVGLGRLGDARNPRPLAGSECDRWTFVVSAPPTGHWCRDMASEKSRATVDRRPA